MQALSEITRYRNTFNYCVCLHRLAEILPVPTSEMLKNLQFGRNQASLPDAIFSRTHSRHSVPGYYRSVPTGRDHFSDAFQALRTWLLSLCPYGTDEDDYPLHGQGQNQDLHKEHSQNHHQGINGSVGC